MAETAQDLFSKLVQLAQRYPLQSLAAFALLWPASHILGPALVPYLQPLLRALMPYLITALLLAAVGTLPSTRPC